MEIKHVKIKDLIKAEYNPRKVSSEQYEHIKSSLLRFGVVDPVIVNSNIDRFNIIIGGHLRCRVWKDLNHEEIPVYYINLSPEKEKELNIRLNKNTGDFDFELLDNFFEKDDLLSWGFDDIEFTETETETERLMIDETDGDDDVNDDDVKSRTVRGDLYQLGNHRLLCGDSTLIDDVEKVMNNNKADIYITDPPYSVNYTKKAKEVLKSKNYTEIKNDNLPVKETCEKLWKPVFCNAYLICKDDASFYMTMPQGGDQMMMMMMMMINENWQVKHELIWVKESPVFSMGRLDYDYKHEPIAYGWKNKHNFYGKGKYLKSVWEIPRLENKLHPTMKPIELIENCLNNSTLKNNIVYDSFLGSGSTLIACEKTNRKCYGIELDEHYCDVIVQRYVDFCKKNDRPFSIVLNGNDITKDYGIH